MKKINPDKRSTTGHPRLRKNYMKLVSPRWWGWHQDMKTGLLRIMFLPDSLHFPLFFFFSFFLSLFFFSVRSVMWGQGCIVCCWLACLFYLWFGSLQKELVCWDALWLVSLSHSALRSLELTENTSEPDLALIWPTKPCCCLLRAGGHVNSTWIQGANNPPTQKHTAMRCTSGSSQVFIPCI